MRTVFDYVLQLFVECAVSFFALEYVFKDDMQ